MADAGDTFDIFGTRFVVKSVNKEQLRTISYYFWQEEGCSSQEEFERIWVDIHPRRGYQPDDWVYFHLFKMLEAQDGN
jgi:hypothetical protein